MRTSTVISVAIGLIAGAFITKQISSRPITPEKALNMVKTKFPLKINGSWIYTTPETFEQNQLTYTVYNGGFTQSSSDGIEHFLFTVDADTGAILKITNNAS